MCWILSQPRKQRGIFCFPSRNPSLGATSCCLASHVPPTLIQAIPPSWAHHTYCAHLSSSNSVWLPWHLCIIKCCIFWPFLMPVLVLARNKISQKRQGVLPVLGNSPLYFALLLVQQRPPVNGATKERFSVWGFFFSPSPQRCFLGNLHLRLQSSGCVIASNFHWVVMQSRSGHLWFFHLCRIRRTTPNPASPFHAAFSWAVRKSINSGSSEWRV